jgi:hypothetical protein
MRAAAVVVLLASFALAPTAAAVQPPGGKKAAAPPSAKRVPPPPPRALIKPPGYAEWLEARHLAERERALRPLFPDSETGRALMHACMLMRGAFRDGDPAGALLTLELAALHRRPEQAFRDLREALSRMSGARAAERQLLIQIGARLPVDRDQRLQLLEEELMRPAKLGPDGLPTPAFFTGTIALGCLLELAPDPKEMLPILTRALKAQPAKEAQRVLLARFYPSAPAQAKRLMNELDLFDVQEKQP